MLKLRPANTEINPVRVWISTVLASVVSLALAPAAFADTTNSSNWAGYAVHRSGVTFRKVTASWRQPTATCSAGRAAYSAFWVGIGGYSSASQALEQIGTETDCSAAGHAVLSAWYELVPAPSTPIGLTLHPGDLINAGVSIAGHTVTMSLYDATRHRGVTKALHASQIDATSAEWIVEAPSDCVSISDCQTLPLADFGSATFSAAHAQSTKGRQGRIADPAWSTTKIKLTPGSRRFIGYQAAGATAGAAIPSSLQARGTAFTVSYSAVSVPFQSARRAAVVAADRLVHPLR